MTASAGRSATLSVAGLVLALHLSVPADAGAQALLPAPREAAFRLTYQHLNLNGHFLTDGSREPGAIPSRAQLAIAEFEYGLTSKLAFNARLPYVASRFTGSDDDPYLVELREIAEKLCQLSPCPVELLSLDTGAYYATFQDFRFMLRYNLFDKWLAVTPLVAVTIPSHDYRTVGEAAAGQNLPALHTGVSLARLLDPVLPRAYVQAQYTYSFVRPVYDISLNRSNAEFEVGYWVTPLVAVRALAAWQQTHGGLSWDEVYGRVFSPDGEVVENPQIQDVLALLDHDRLLADRYWHVGGGTTVSLTNSLDLDAALITFVSGADSHYGVGANVSLTWRGASFVRARPSARFGPSLPSR